MLTDEMLKTFCSNVRYYRKKHGLSRWRMARIMGIRIKSVRLLEADVIPPDVHWDALRRLCDYFLIPDAAEVILDHKK